MSDLALSRRQATGPFPHVVQESSRMIADADRVPPMQQQMPVLNSADLLGSSREIVIQHGTEAYRLRLTRHDKLILTK